MRTTNKQVSKTSTEACERDTLARRYLQASILDCVATNKEKRVSNDTMRQRDKRREKLFTLTVKLEHILIFAHHFDLLTQAHANTEGQYEWPIGPRTIPLPKRFARNVKKKSSWTRSIEYQKPLIDFVRLV